MEELLRYLSVRHGTLTRTATRDTTVDGQVVAEGDLVEVSLAMANRDPAVHQGDPSTLDLGRSAPHLAFGHGIHHCLGAPLARVEMRIAFPRLARRFPMLALAMPDPELAFRTGAIVFGLDELPVTW